MTVGSRQMFARFKSSKAVQSNQNQDSLRRVWGDLKALGEEMDKAITLPRVVDLTAPDNPVRQQHLSQQV
jgi:hypothetical protein